MAIEEEMKVVRVHHTQSQKFDWSKVNITAGNILFLRFDGKERDMIKQAQLEAYLDELDRTNRGKPFSELAMLSPTSVLDESGLGWNSEASFKFKINLVQGSSQDSYLTCCFYYLN